MSSPVALGLDLGGTFLKWGGVSSDGRILFQGKEPLDDLSQKGTLELLQKAVRQGQDRLGADIAGIGVGAPGLVDISRRIIRVAPNFPQWKDFQLAGLLEESFPGVPIILENDANLVLYSETSWGKAVGIDDLVILTLGTGVGGGVLVKGEVLKGVGGGAGELGHIPVDPNGALCGCGAKGCLETFCSINGVMRAAEEIYCPEPFPASPDMLTEAARQGDRAAIETWRRVGWALGVGIAAFINIFNPSLILIGGGVSGAGELLLEPARETASQRSYSHNWNDVRVERAGFGENAGLLGAAVIAFRQAGIETGKSMST